MNHRICSGGAAAAAVLLSSAAAFAGTPAYTTGPADGVRGWLSSTNPSGISAFAADDFILPQGNGFDYIISGFEGSMYLSVPEPPPVLTAILYEHTPGGPGNVIGSFDATMAIDSGVAGPIPNTRRFDIVVDGLALNVSPDTRYWLAWHASGSDMGTVAGYFATAGNGVVQGEEAHFIGAAYGAPNWTPVSQRPSGVASDLSFSVFATQLVPTPGAGLLLAGAGALAAARRRRD